ncbi:hypothetical protein N2152v2_001144 [Parachlorella kessleri]
MLADDIVVLASTAEGLQRFLTALEAACQRWGLTFSQSKTELMLVGGAAATVCKGCGALQPQRSMLICGTCQPTSRRQQPVQMAARYLVGGSVLCWVEKFKYLGSHFTDNIDLNAELGYRLSLGAAVFDGVVYEELLKQLDLPDGSIRTEWTLRAARGLVSSG